MSKGPANTHLAQALYAWRTAEGLTQEEAAKYLGITHRSFQGYERGEIETPRPRTRNRMAKLMGIEPHELLGGPATDDGATKAIQQMMEAMRQEMARVADSQADNLREIERLRQELERERKRQGSKPRRRTRRSST